MGGGAYYINLGCLSVQSIAKIMGLFLVVAFFNRKFTCNMKICGEDYCKNNALFNAVCSY